MRILVCGGRDFGHVVRTKPTPEEESPEVQAKIMEYQYVHSVLHAAIMAYSTERNDEDNWLPTDIIIIEGGARGADAAAWDFAVINFTRHMQFKANWKRFGKAAGHFRNTQMLVDGKPDLVIAFPGGEGTANMVSQAKADGVPVIECDGKTIPKFERKPNAI